MDEIRTLIVASENYDYGGKHYDERRVTSVEGVRYHTFQNEDYDEHYRICCEAATNFINTSNVFSELKPEEIIKVFASMEFKDNRILIDSGTLHTYRHDTRSLKLFEELLKSNKEMLLALIKANNDKKISHAKSHHFIDDNGVLGANSGATDDEMIRLYRILLEYNHFSLDNLNIKNIINEIRPSMIKRAVK